jgi:hypothetical protein
VVGFQLIWQGLSIVVQFTRGPEGLSIMQTQLETATVTTTGIPQGGTFTVLEQEFSLYHPKAKAL